MGRIHASLASQVSVLSFWRRHTWAVGGRGIAAVGYGLRDRGTHAAGCRAGGLFPGAGHLSWRASQADASRAVPLPDRNAVNMSASRSGAAVAPKDGFQARVLTWEHWANIPVRGRDVDRANRSVIVLVFHFWLSVPPGPDTSGCIQMLASAKCGHGGRWVSRRYWQRYLALG